MIDSTNAGDENNYESDGDSDELSFKSSNSFIPILQEDEENLRQTPNSLNNYCILPPIKSATKDNQPSPQQCFIRNLQEKYQQPTDNNEVGNDAKLDDAYLKMKRLDKALEEAFEKEKLVKFETISLMKKLRSEMQSMSITPNADTNELSHTQTNLKRFFELDDEILKLDGFTIDDENLNPTESIFKTQLNDPLGDSNSSHKSDKESVKSNTKKSSFSRKKKSSISSTSSTNTKDGSKKTKIPEKDFIKRNIQLAKEVGGTWALTDDEKKRLNQLLNEDDQENAVALPNQSINGYIPSMNDTQRLKEIDDLLEKEYYNPFLNHQLRRNTTNDIDYSDIRQITNEENDYMENHFGEQILKETRLQREHMQRLRKIDEQLERIHRPVEEEENTVAILSDDQITELLGQCAVDEMKQRFSLLNPDTQENPGIDFNDLSNYTLTHYVEDNQGPLITDEIIQLLLNEAQQEGITMRKIDDKTEEDDDDLVPHQQAGPSSLAPIFDRPISSTSASSHVEMYNRNPY